MNKLSSFSVDTSADNHISTVSLHFISNTLETYIDCHNILDAELSDLCNQLSALCRNENACGWTISQFPYTSEFAVTVLCDSNEDLSYTFSCSRLDIDNYPIVKE